MERSHKYQELNWLKSNGAENQRGKSGRAAKGARILPVITTARGGDKRILIVDDNEGIRCGLLAALSVMGYEAAAVCSGVEALNVFFRNPFDLVITDLQMPGMDGWTLASLIKDRFPDTPVVLITGEQKEEVMKDQRRHCIDSALFKPLRMQELERELKKMLGVESSGMNTPC
jgi:CheY-like chemotaxis protein